MSLTVAPPASADPQMTPGYCPCHSQAAAFDHWLAALKLYGTGRTASDLRAQSADPAWVAGLAYVDGITPEQERAELAATADAIDALTPAGLTPEGAYRLAGLDRDLGPYEDYAGFSRLPEVAA